MTSSSLSFARKALTLALGAALFVGCGAEGNGEDELNAGKAAFNDNDISGAEKLFAKSLKHDAGNVETLLYQTRVKLERGDIKSAKELIEKALACEGDSLDVKLLHAQVAYHEQDYDMAMREYVDIATNNLNSPENRAAALCGIGVIEMSRNNYDAARVNFFKAQRLDRRNAASWYHLGLLYRDSYNFIEAARDQFKTFLYVAKESDRERVTKVKDKIIPELEAAIEERRSMFKGADKRDEEACKKALAKAEDNMKKGMYPAARLCYIDAVNADALSYDAAYGLAKAWERSYQTKESQAKAFDYYVLACKLAPNKISTHITAAHFALKLGYPAQACEIYSRALAADPNNLQIVQGLVEAFKAAGNMAKIADTYQEYADTLPRPKAVTPAVKPAPAKPQVKPVAKPAAKPVNKNVNKKKRR